MTLSRLLTLAALMVGVHIFPACAADVPKDKSAFTSYIQNKLQLYSPAPINVDGPLSLSVGPSAAAVKLPSLKPLHKRCVASPAKCDDAINNFVQDTARDFLQKQAAATPGATQEVDSFVSTDKPTCILVDGPNANPRDKCTPPRVDWQKSPRPSMPDPVNTCLTGQEGVVIVSFSVRADGTVSNAAVYLSSDFQRLDDAAVSHIAARHYVPATKNGTPVDTLSKSMKTTFIFSCSPSFGPSGATKMTAAPSQTRATANSTDKPTCFQFDGPNANPHDTCTLARIDWQHSPAPFTPKGVCLSGQEGTVIVGFTVHADGSASDASVLVSSDIRKLDDSAVSQVISQHYFPATKNGAPIDTAPKSMKTKFQFSCSEFGSFAPDQTHPPANPEFGDKPSCLHVDGPNADPRDTCTPAHIDWNHTVQVPFQFSPTRGGDIQDAIVDFTVHADGSVSDLAVTRSSGLQTFDTSAVNRIAARHYVPATKNGTPIDVHIRSAVGVCIVTACRPSETPLPDDPPK